MSRVESEYKDLDKFVYKDEHVSYYKKDTAIQHNPYGPATSFKNGYKEYIIEGMYHRLDGPAIICGNGVEEYWINGEYLNKEQFEVHPERLKFLHKEHLVCLV